MTALSDAERAVAEARRDVHDYFVLLAATNADLARAAVSRLEDAVRRHDMEVVRALHYEPGSDTIKDAWKDGQESAADAIADRLRPGPFPEVEVRFVGGPTVRIARFTVTTEAEVGLVAVEGFLSSWTGYPNSGDAVRIAYLGIPGRGALADITASVAVYTRMEVLNIRIRTTIRPWEPTP